MEQTLSYVHPNPGWSQQKDEKRTNSFPSSELGNQIGKHCILDLYECDPIKLNDEAFVRTTLTTSAKNAGATLLNLITHRFEPYGVTGLALLAESHISIHTWPENRYAACDVFTCGDHTMPEKACELIAQEFMAGYKTLQSFSRKTSMPKK